MLIQTNSPNMKSIRQKYSLGRFGEVAKIKIKLVTDVKK
jgi:hypothetical protein